MKLISRLTNLFSGSIKPSQKIREIFFDLIQNNRGSITEIDLAMAANISGTDAKKYLEQFAVEFDATFEVTEKGHVVYLFPIRNQTPKTDKLKTSPNSLSEAKKNIEAKNIQLNSLETSQVRKNPANSSQKQQQNYRTKTNYQVANIKNNLENTEREIKENVENVENEIKENLKNVGDSLNNLFK